MDAELRNAQSPAAAAATAAALRSSSAAVTATAAASATGTGTPLADALQGASGTPLLLTRGTKDVSSAATAQRVLETVPAARLATFEGSGALAHVDARSAYNEKLLAFLDEVDGVATRRAVMLPGSMAPGGSVRD